MNPLISIVIPCYNHGEFLPDAINSVLNSKTNIPYEIIVVNDGSTDQFTIDTLNNYNSQPGVQVINQVNQGLGAARNNGIKLARGVYILPLDSDNLLKPDFIESAVKLMQSDPTIDIVYTNAEVFGDHEFTMEPGVFDIHRMLIVNYIDACSIYKKKVWEVNGGYATDMPAMGHEDWEFWISSYFNRFKFNYQSFAGFRYRFTGGSMLRSVTTKKETENKSYIFTKHNKGISTEYEALYQEHQKLKTSYNYLMDHPYKTVAKKLLGRI